MVRARNYVMEENNLESGILYPLSLFKSPNLIHIQILKSDLYTFLE